MIIDKLKKRITAGAAFVTALFSAAPALAASDDHLIAKIMPEWLRNDPFLMENWQWLALLALALGCVFVERIFSYAFTRLNARWFGVEDDDKEKTKSGRPFGLMAASGLWLLTINLFDFPGRVLAVLQTAGFIVLGLAGIWSAFKVIDLVCGYFMKLSAKTETKLDDLLVPMTRRTLKVFVVAFGLIFIADNLDIDMTSLLAGVGLGGLAFALAAKDTVANIFGSITVLVDRPFQVGDWVIIGDVEGSVEDVGLRTTRVRTFYNSLMTMPNSKLTNSIIDNMGARKYRRIKTMISIQYDTPPEKIDAFCEGIRELIRLHPYSRTDYFHVYLNAFNASSLDVLLYSFLDCPDWATELREKHRLFLDIIRLAKRLGVEFAFPTQTIHMAKDGGPGGPDVPNDMTGAEQFGRKEAEDIFDGTLGKGCPKPPPVTFE